MSNWNQLSLGLDFSRPPQPVIMVAKATQPVVVEEASVTWAAVCVRVLILLTAYAGSQNMPWPVKPPPGIPTGVAALVTEAYGLGVCSLCGVDPDEELDTGSSLADSHRVLTGGA